jgi:peptidoglycan/LPS O-acetylase OafA/YrhL
MSSTESSTQDTSTPTYAAPAPNPFLLVSDRSSRLTLIVLVSCALTVALTRLFLVLTGYPQIGNSTFHLAHALWGGLALFLAGMMALIVQNRGAAVIIALLTGVGFGLFVDEVGKFITQKNDYFFPLAAPIVYASLLLILLLTELARRHQLRSPRAHLLAAISLSQTVADGTASQQRSVRCKVTSVRHGPVRWTTPPRRCSTASRLQWR